MARAKPNHPNAKPDNRKSKGICNQFGNRLTRVFRKGKVGNEPARDQRQERRAGPESEALEPGPTFALNSNSRQNAHRRNNDPETEGKCALSPRHAAMCSLR